ncbi:MAG TPA: (d)CMP kinase [Candidatus Saccharibacteria bacterium]|nr:(d)CMP kinase [Candidatus Saccharibacteria bacterium]
MTDFPLPRLITFDGEARSGKGTIVQFTKDYLRDELNLKTMLIDRGQTFRTLVVAAARAGIDLDDADAIDAYLSDPDVVANCVQFVKDVYHMSKDERDALLYTNEVGENSAKIGARPASQAFVANLTKKWLHDADNEGYEVVLIDGRALEAISREMDDEGLCHYRLGLYFICDGVVGARRTLGYAATPYDQLTDDQREEVDVLVGQIAVRNQRDFDRDVERLVRPDAPLLKVPELVGVEMISSNQPMAVIDTSAEVSKVDMSLPVAKLVAHYV